MRGGHLLVRASQLWGHAVGALAALGAALLFLMMALICTDVLLRNVALVPGLRGLAWSNEISESMLYVVTLLTAPWLLRRGQHIRVDIVLRAIPPRAGWYCEWVSDALALICCLALAYYGLLGTIASYQSSAMTIKTLITPEWWLLSVIPVAFFLLAIEFVFRMHRLFEGERAPREDAVSTG